MATKAKTAAIKDKDKDQKAAETPEKDSADAPSPLLDLSDAAVKKMIKQAKKRGFVTFDQLNDVLPSESTSPEQIEDVMAMLSDMGINVSENDDENDDVHRHFVAWVLRELMHERVDVVFTSEDYGEGFAGVLSAE